jgi:hypothetical protein
MPSSSQQKARLTVTQVEVALIFWFWGIQSDLVNQKGGFMIAAAAASSELLVILLASYPK